MNLYLNGQTVSLNMQLSDGFEDQYPQAHVYLAGALEISINLSHVALGMYAGNWTPATQGTYHIIYQVFHDVGRTIDNPFYTREIELWRAFDDFDDDIVLARKMLQNRLELSEESTDNWVLYDDDGVTPLIKWDVKTKNDEDIEIPRFAPAKRNPTFP